MGQEQQESKYPTLEEFGEMSVEDRAGLFTRFPISAQKVLVSLSAYSTSVGQVLLKEIRGVEDTKEAEGRKSPWTPEEFDGAIEFLLQTPYFRKFEDSQSKTERYEIVNPVKDFINTDLRKLWEKQKSSVSK